MKYYRFSLYLLLFILVSCKNSFLDIKPDRELLVPQTLNDLQAMVDNSSIFNLSVPIQGIIAADEYYLDFDRWNTLSVPAQKNGYIWAKDNFYEGRDSDGWNLPYRAIFYSNLILEEIEKVKRNDGNRNQWSSVKGSALFFRGWSYYQLAQVFCDTYVEDTAEERLGLPIRLIPDINARIARASLAETYERVVSDLTQAVRLLPTAVTVPTRPSKAAAYALLSKVFLQIGGFETALSYADSCLALKNTLLDYNLVEEEDYPFARFNDEVIFHSSNTGIILSNTRLNPDTLLYQSYTDADLRKSLFFKQTGGRLTYRGSYDGSSRMFCGIATDEIYLIRAECFARSGMVREAMEDLNVVLVSRFKEKGFVPISASDPTEALDFILSERKKQLVFRGTRWHDLKRLNTDPRYAVTLIRKLSDETYELTPGDFRYALPIPDLVIELAEIQQNPGY